MMLCCAAVNVEKEKKSMRDGGNKSKYNININSFSPKLKSTIKMKCYEMQHSFSSFSTTLSSPPLPLFSSRCVVSFLLLPFSVKESLGFT